MFKPFILCCAAFLSFGGFTHVGYAEDLPPSPIVKTELILNAPIVHADEVIWAGVTYTIPKHWHIYWQNPGDSGIPTTMQWTLPAGITAGEILWPVPERIETSGLVTYGYSNTITLPVPLTPSRDNVKGAISVTTKWLVCKDACVPETATLSASLPNANFDAAKTLDAAVMQAPQSALDATASYATIGDQVLLGIAGAALLPPGAAPVTKAMFFPLDDGIITNIDMQTFKLNSTGSALTLSMKRGSGDLLPQWHGVLSLTRGNETHNFTLTLKLEVGAPAMQTTAAVKQIGNTSFFLALGLAFLGGLVLNIMPCVLPILALKALSLVKKAEASRKAAARQGFAYTTGVVASFMIIAAGMLALKASGAAIGWGFQLQHSGFVGFLLVLILLISANLLGLFELPVFFGNRAMQTKDDTLGGSFLTGVLAVLVATPCTAPFMATAIGATLTYSAPQALLVFAILGLGMAAPFLLISLWPAACRLLPKPGRWMQRFKQWLAIPMLATAAWLAWVLMQLHSPSLPLAQDHVAYSPAGLAQLRAAGKPVLVDATAAWCLSCKVNERVALQPASMQQFFREKNVTIMVADWTSSSADITTYLAGFNRGGVPLYVYYGPYAEPTILPQILTPSLVRGVITGAPN